MSVGIPALSYQQIEHLSLARGVARAVIIRAALEDYLSRIEADDNPDNISGVIEKSISRLALTSEFTQAGVDVLLRELPSDRRDEVMRTVDQRMEKYYGKK